MAHSYNRVWIHSIWSTKYRNDLITEDIEKTIYNYMYEQFKKLNCPARIINGMPDHIHCFYNLHNSKSVAQVMKQVKGSTSRFINKGELTEPIFSWQIGSASFSVSKSVEEAVYYYIRSQKKHHKKKSFKQEFGKLHEKS